MPPLSHHKDTENTEKKFKVECYYSGVLDLGGLDIGFAGQSTNQNRDFATEWQICRPRRFENRSA